MPEKPSLQALRLRPSTKTADSKALSSTEVAYQWILKFAVITGKIAEHVQQDVWAETLKDIPADQLNAACERLMKTWRLPNLPTPGDVRAQLDLAEARGFDLEAEAVWQKLLSWIRENLFPDTGIRRGAPPLAPATVHAAKAAGGIYFIERCSEDQLVWCRKEFLVTYKNAHEARQVEHLLGNGEAKRVLAQLRAGPTNKRKQLSCASESPSQPPSREEVREVLRSVMEKKPARIPEPSQEELAARLQLQKEQARQWAIDHGMEPPLAAVNR